MGHHGRQRTDLMLVRAKTLEVKRNGTTVVDMMSTATNIYPSGYLAIFSIVIPALHVHREGCYDRA